MAVPSSPAMPVTPLPLVVDGRRARAERSRDAVVEAILDLINEKGDLPSATGIAARAGVSVRSVFRYFDDLEALHVTAIRRHVERVAHLYEAPVTTGALTRRVDALVRSRAALFEAITPVRRVAERLRGRSPAIDAQLAEARDVLRAQLAAQFTPELGELSAPVRREMLAALESTTAWSTWNLLRGEQGCSKAQAEAVMRRTVRALLDA